LVQPPAGGVGEAEEPQCLARGRAIDDDHVVVLGLDVALEDQQREQLVAARRDGQLLGGDPVHAALHQQAAQPLRDRAPVVLELVLGLYLLGVQALGDRRRLAADLGLQRVGEAVGGIGGDDERARALGGAAPGGGGGDGGLPDAALARVENRSG